MVRYRAQDIPPLHHTPPSGGSGEPPRTRARLEEQEEEQEEGPAPRNLLGEFEDHASR